MAHALRVRDERWQRWALNATESERETPRCRRPPNSASAEGVPCASENEQRVRSASVLPPPTAATLRPPLGIPPNCRPLPTAQHIPGGAGDRSGGGRECGEAQARPQRQYCRRQQAGELQSRRLRG